MNSKPIPYTIQAGDTLYSISEKLLKGVLWEKDPKTGSFNILPDQKKIDVSPTRAQIKIVIDLIKTQNAGMTDAIQAGKKISLPAQDDALIAAGLKSAPEKKINISDDPIITGANDKDTQKERKNENAPKTGQSWPEGVPIDPRQKTNSKNKKTSEPEIKQPKPETDGQKFGFKFNKGFTKDFEFTGDGSIISKLADIKAPLLGQSALYAGANILYGTPRLNAYMDTKAGRLGIHNGLEGATLPAYAKMDGANFQGGLTAYYPETQAHLNPSLTNLVGLRAPIKDRDFLGGELTHTYINAGVSNGLLPIANATTTYQNGEAKVSVGATYQEKNIRGDMGFSLPIIESDKFSMTPAIMHTSNFAEAGYTHLSTAALNLKTVLKAFDELTFSVSAAPYAQYGNDGVNYGARGAATTEVSFGIGAENGEEKRTEFKANVGLICNLDKNTGLTYGPVFGLNLNNIKP